MPFTSRRSRPGRSARRVLSGLLGTILAVGSVASATSGADAPAAATEDRAASGGLLPSIHYEHALAHADDATEFAPGGRVTVGFTPRAGDGFLIGGDAPRRLPAGRLSGSAMRGGAPAREPDPAPAPAPVDEPVDEPTPSPGSPTATPEAPAPTADPSTAPAPDAPIGDPSAAIAATTVALETEPEAGSLEAQAPVSASGLRKEVFGFLPYWELNDGTVLDYSKLSTIAFFGVGAAASGALEKTKSGTTTVGWSGWTSSRMTQIINDAHRNKTRVVLTVQSFAWSDAGKTKQAALLGSSTARLNLAKQAAAAVRDRGADGINLDFEPIVSGYGDEFTALVRTMRAELDKVQKGYQLTFDTTGYIGNYPIEDATASGGADAIFIMGYDYRNGSSSTAGSIAPIGGPAYDITDTILAYTARVSPSKLILGVPYYGRAWSTETSALNSKNISGTKNGASSTVLYVNALPYLSDHGRKWDSREGVAWTVYRRENCTSTYGCVKPWRQLYVDDAAALKLKYDLINRYGLRGAGIWALGYDGSRTELWTALRDKFITDTTPPIAGIKTLATTQSSETFLVDWTAKDDFGLKDFDLDVSIDGGSWARWLTKTTLGEATYVGARGHDVAFRVRGRDHKGNTSDWSDVPRSSVAPKIGVGGFAKVVSATLNGRAAAGTDQPILQTLATGDLVGFLEGPVSADGYTWYRVAAPLASWGPVSYSRSDLWVATGTSGDPFLSAVVAPNSTTVSPSASLASTSGASWHGVTPVRLLDTRSANGLSGSFVSGTVRTVQMAGRGGIPSDAVAVTANVTITGPTAPGYLAIGPSMTSTPTTSALNVTKGTTLANGITLRLSGSGAASAVFIAGTTGKAHVILDVTGYYRDDAGATWTPISATRLLDTRSANGLSGSFAAGKVRTFTVAGRAGIPSDAVAVTGNLTAVGPTRSGYVAIGPMMTTSPSTSTLNIRGGQTLANNVTLRLGAGGTVGAIYRAPSGAKTHLLFDVTGYYRNGSGGAEWFPVAPVRLLDTRASNGLSGASRDGTVRTFLLAGRGTVPVDALAVTANLTVTGPTSAGYVTVGTSLTSQPPTSNVNIGKGGTLANGVALRVVAGRVGAVFQGATGSTAHLILDVSGYFR